MANHFLKALLEKYFIVKSLKDVLIFGLSSLATGFIIYLVRGAANAPYVCFVAGIALGLLLLKKNKTEKG